MSGHLHLLGLGLVDFLGRHLEGVDWLDGHGVLGVVVGGWLLGMLQREDAVVRRGENKRARLGGVVEGLFIQRGLIIYGPVKNARTHARTPARTHAAHQKSRAGQQRRRAQLPRKQSCNTVQYGRRPGSSPVAGGAARCPMDGPP